MDFPIYKYLIIKTRVPMKMEKSTKEGEGGGRHLNGRNPLGLSDHKLKPLTFP